MKGQVLIEGCSALLVVFLTMLMNLELVRRAQYEVVFHHATFLSVRERVLGLTSEQMRDRMKKFLRVALGEPHASVISRKWLLEEEMSKEGYVLSVKIRFRTFLRFPYRDSSKHHFEMTNPCLFRL